MSAEPVKGWDSRVLLAAESAWGTSTAPAASQEIETISCVTGPSELGNSRPKKDRNSGRGMQAAFVEGRVQPIAFAIETSVKSRVAAVTAAKEQVLYNAAGFFGSSSGSAWVNTSDADPVTAGDFASFGIYRALGGGVACYEAEQLRGCIVKSLQWSGGDKEITLKASGEGIGKYHMGYLTSISLLIGDLTMTVSAEESYRLSVGYYQIESEVIAITAITDGGTSATITRAQLGTSAAAHSSKPVYPYFPAISYTGSPISEANMAGCTLDGVALRVMSFSIDYTTGLDMLPGESGSRFVQGMKTLRYSATASLKTVLHREEVSWLGKVRGRKNVALSLNQGTGTGGQMLFSMPYCEIDPIAVPDTAADVVIVDLKLKGKDSAGNDMLLFNQS